MTVRIDYSLNNDCLHLHMWTEDYERKRHFVAGKEGISVKRGETPPDAVSHTVSSSLLQELLDELIAQGYRPSSNTWAAGHVADLKAHIGFAEKIALKLLDSKNAAPEG